MRTGDRRPAVNVKSLAAAALTTFLTAAVPNLAAAQEIPRRDYRRFFPLEDARIVRQTEATAELGLYGDATAPGYEDRRIPPGDASPKKGTAVAANESPQDPP